MYSSGDFTLYCIKYLCDMHTRYELDLNFALIYIYAVTTAKLFVLICNK